MKTVTIDGQEWEVKWHDSGSTTETIQLVREIEKPVPVLRVYFDELGWPCMLLPEEIKDEIPDRWIWLALSARIAAYYPEYKYMAVDDDGQVFVWEKRPPFVPKGKHWENGESEGIFILQLPEVAIPQDCSKAIVEVRHG